MDIGFQAGSPDPGKRRVVGRYGLQARHELSELRLAVAGPDAADIDKMFAAMDDD